MGVPDQVFVLTGTVLHNVVDRWTTVPGTILLSQLCPSGREATMMALLAGSYNLGRAMASVLGACLLEYLEVSPDGTEADAGKFEWLWVAALVQAVGPLLTLTLVPAMIPDLSQRGLAEDDGEACRPLQPRGYPMLQSQLRTVHDPGQASRL
eukprot:5194410-Amphidinium_carterae.1